MQDNCNGNYLCISVTIMYISFQFDWLGYLNGLFASVEYQFTNSSELVIYEPTYLKKVCVCYSIQTMGSNSFQISAKGDSPLLFGGKEGWLVSREHLNFSWCQE